MDSNTTKRANALREKKKAAETGHFDAAKRSLSHVADDVRSVLESIEKDNPDLGLTLDKGVAWCRRARAELADAEDRIQRVINGREIVAAVAAVITEPIH